MKVAAVIGVCDEVEMIEPCVRHAAATGVDAIVVVDSGSKDGTAEVLARLVAAGMVSVLRTDGDPEKDLDYMLAGVRHARALFSPDWILLQDADEFLLPRSGDVKAILDGARADVVRLDRFNACPTERLRALLATRDAPDVAAIDIFVQELRLSRAAMDADPTIAWVSARPVEKVIARAGVIAGIAAGAHGVLDADGRPVPHVPAQDAVVVHVPFSSKTRFFRKVENIGRLFARNPNMFSGAGGWHWRRWCELSGRGALHAEFEAQQLDAATLERLRAEGVVARAAAYLDRARPPMSG